MSRAISIDGVLPLDLARARACPAKMLGAGVKSDCSAPALRVWRHARGTALGMGARDDRARQLGARPTVVQTDTFARASSWGRYRQRARERCKQRPRVTSKARVTKCYQAFRIPQSRFSGTGDLHAGARKVRLIRVRACRLCNAVACLFSKGVKGI